VREITSEAETQFKNLARSRGRA